jgi:ribosomal protein S21
MIIVQVKEGENIERALKKFKRKYEKTGIVKEDFVWFSSVIFLINF